jgi:expansin (peptidoglycan-binding protein)
MSQRYHARAHARSIALARPRRRRERQGVRAAWILVCAACGGGSVGPGNIDAKIGGACSDPPAAETGDGTYYTTADGSGNCGFPATPNDLNVAAMNAADYNNATWCGACLDVTGPNGHVVVRVVDQCPGCAHGDLDLSPQAFQQLAPLSAGRVAISWHEVPCNVTGPIEYEFKDGSNPYWTAIQIRNARYPIATVESKGAGGAWSAIPRVDYNYFVDASGLGNGPYALRVTDQRGHVIEDDSVPFTGAATETPSASQFDLCPGGT